MVDVKEWLKKRDNRRMLLLFFPYITGAILFYFLMGFMTSFLAISIVYGFFTILIAMFVGVGLAYTYIEDWADKGDL